MNNEIEEARARLREIENQLSFEVNRMMTGFKKQFGVPVTSATINLIDARTIDSKGPDYIAHVRLGVEL